MEPPLLCVAPDSLPRISSVLMLRADLFFSQSVLTLLCEACTLFYGRRLLQPHGTLIQPLLECDDP